MNSSSTELPLVTIGVPVYNGEAYLAKALASLVAQDYGNFEIVVSDNCSTDGSLAICRAFAARDPRVRVEVQATNIGHIANFRALAAGARGAYFMWAAVDDFWLPSFVSRAVAELEAHPEAAVAMTAVDRVREDGTLYDQLRFDDVNGRSHYELVRRLTSPHKINVFIYGLFRTALLQEAMKHQPEVQTWERLLLCQIALAAQFRYVDEMLHERMHHELSFTKRTPDQVYTADSDDRRPAPKKILLAYADMLARSTVIPWHRRAYAPLILGRYGWMLVRPRLRAQLERKVGRGLWKTLEPVRRMFRAS